MSLRALREGKLGRKLIRAIFELRLLVIEGEYDERPPSEEEPGLLRIWEHVITSPLSGLYSEEIFADEKADEGFIREALLMSRRICRHDFRSLSLL